MLLLELQLLPPAAGPRTCVGLHFENDGDPSTPFLSHPFACAPTPPGPRSAAPPLL